MNISGQGHDGRYVLVYQGTSHIVKVGDEVRDFRGDKAIVHGGKPPHKDGAEGYVEVSTKPGQTHRMLYAGVYDTEWVQYDPQAFLKS